ncbi:hypothetical protein ACP275_02G131800 [Erythranthe tilingii]
MGSNKASHAGAVLALVILLSVLSHAVEDGGIAPSPAMVTGGATHTPPLPPIVALITASLWCCVGLFMF